MCVLATRLPFIITIEHFNVVEGGVFKFSKKYWQVPCAHLCAGCCVRAKTALLVSVLLKMRI